MYQKLAEQHADTRWRCSRARRKQSDKLTRLPLFALFEYVDDPETRFHALYQTLHFWRIWLGRRDTPFLPEHL